MPDDYSIIAIIVPAVSSILSGIFMVISRHNKVEQANSLNKNNLLYTNKELEETKKDVVEVRKELRELLEMLTDIKLKIHTLTHDLEGQKNSFLEVKNMVQNMRIQERDSHAARMRRDRDHASFLMDEQQRKKRMFERNDDDNNNNNNNS